MTPEEYRRYLLMMNQWLILRQEGKTLGKYLMNHCYQRVAVYGMGLYGRHVVRELAGSEVHIIYGVDIKETESYMGVEIIRPTEEMKDIDLIINSSLRYADDIRESLKDKCDCEIIDLDELVFAAYDNDTV